MASWIKQKLANVQKDMKNHKIVTWLKNWLNLHPSLWKINKYSVSGGVALGLFVGFIPIPIQTILIVIFAIFIRVNLPTAFLASFIINPIAFIPANYLVYKTGEFLLYGKYKPDDAINFSFDMSYHGFIQWLGSFGKIYLVGFPIVSVGIAMIGYAIVYVTWTIYENIRKR